MRDGVYIHTIVQNFDAKIGPHAVTRAGDWNRRREMAADTFGLSDGN